MSNNLCLTMLGTVNATVTKCYNTCFLLHEKFKMKNSAQLVYEILEIVK